MFGDSANQLTQQLATLDKGRQIVLIHPDCMCRHIVLGTYVVGEILYVSFRGEKLSFEELSEQYHRFMSSYVDHVLPFILILDECDRIQDTALDVFLEKITRDRTFMRIILLTRRIPWCIYNSPSIHPLISLIPSKLWHYLQCDETLDVLEVRAFGEGSIYLNARHIEHWDGVLPRALFFYLVDRGMATRSEIFEIFWPKLSEKEATNVFHVTKRKISEAISADLMVYWSGFYTISPQFKLNYDVITFAQLAQLSAVAEDQSDAIDFLKQSIHLYKGKFLHTLDMDWAKTRREELNNDFNDELEILAQLELSIGHKDIALGLYLRAMANSDSKSRLALEIIKIYQQSGKFQESIEVYEALKSEATPILHELAKSLYAKMNTI